MTTYNVRSSPDASYGVFDTLEAAEHALRMVRRHDPDAQIIIKRDWRDRALTAEAEVETLRAEVAELEAQRDSQASRLLAVREVCDRHDAWINVVGGYPPSHEGQVVLVGAILRALDGAAR